MKYTVARGDQVFGEYSLEDIRSKVQSGDLVSSDLVYCDEFENWKTIGEVPELISTPQAPIRPVPDIPPIPDIPAGQVGSAGKKSKFPIPVMIGAGVVGVGIIIVVGLMMFGGGALG